MAHTPEAVVEIFHAALTDMAQIEPGTRLDGASVIRDLGMDSLSLLEFLMLVEDRTGVEVTSDDATFDTTIDELAAFVSRKSA